MKPPQLTNIFSTPTARTIALATASSHCPIMDHRRHLANRGLHGISRLLAKNWLSGRAASALQQGPRLVRFGLLNTSLNQHVPRPVDPTHTRYDPVIQLCP